VNLSSGSSILRQGRRCGSGRANLATVLFISVGLLYSLATLYPVTTQFFSDVGMVGATTDYDGSIKLVDPGSPSDTSGIVAGLDHFDFSAMRPKQLMYVAPSASFAPPKSTIEVSLWRLEGTRSLARRLKLTIAPVPLSLPDLALLALRILAAIIFFAVGAILLFLRPAPSTWGFFIYSIGLNPAAFDQRFLRYPSPQMWVANVVLVDVLLAAGICGITAFALTIEDSSPVGWRRYVFSSLPFVFAICAALESWPDIASIWLGKNSEPIQNLMFIIEFIVLTLGFSALIHFFYQRPASRQRLSWIILGYGIGVYANFFAGVYAYSSVLLVNYYILEPVLVTLNVILPIAVGYGVIRHQLLGVKLVISRAIVALVLTALTAIVSVIFDHIVSEKLHPREHDTGVHPFAATIFLITAGVVAWLFSLVRERVGAGLNALIYGKREAGRRQLQDDAVTLSYSVDEKDLDALVVRAPREAFNLSAARLYAVDPKGREAVMLHSDLAGVLAGSPTNSGDDEIALVPLLLQAAQLRDSITCSRDMSDAWIEANPVLSDSVIVPLFTQHRVGRIAAYSPHQNGEELDSVEVAALVAFCRSAGVVYPSTRINELRSKITKLESRVSSLEAHQHQ
jgi:hypothetical protein